MEIFSSLGLKMPFQLGVFTLGTTTLPTRAHPSFRTHAHLDANDEKRSAAIPGAPPLRARPDPPTRPCASRETPQHVQDLQLRPTRKGPLLATCGEVVFEPRFSRDEYPRLGIVGQPHHAFGGGNAGKLIAVTLRHRDDEAMPVRRLRT